MSAGGFRIMAMKQMGLHSCRLCTWEIIDLVKTFKLKLCKLNFNWSYKNVPFDEMNKTVRAILNLIKFDRDKIFASSQIGHSLLWQPIYPADTVHLWSQAPTNKHPTMVEAYNNNIEANSPSSMSTLAAACRSYHNSSSNLHANDNVKPWFPSESIARSIEWLDDIMHSNFWVKCKGYAGVATQGTAKPPACAGGHLVLPQAGGAVKARGRG
ncbi:hypothetical protein EDD22DRAFT_1026797 [Suillus occidentalis]|nr:hypothetical protein EDD22DRAFT_1026797 [Suillus occidentalis]